MNLLKMVHIIKASITFVIGLIKHIPVQFCSGTRLAGAFAQSLSVPACTGRQKTLFPRASDRCGSFAVQTVCDVDAVFYFCFGMVSGGAEPVIG